MDNTIIILGAGVAGLSAAIALTEKGFSVAVFERNNTISNLGGGIVCWPNGTVALQKLGVVNELRHYGGESTTMKRFTKSGELLGEIDISTVNNLMKEKSYAILRKDLMEILYQRAMNLGITIHFSHEVQVIENDSNDVVVKFTNGKIVKSSIVLGAEGRMKSIARQYVLGDNKPVYQQFINWVGVFESDDDIFSDLSIKDFWGVGERFGIVPISSRKAYWAGGKYSETIDLKNSNEYKSELMRYFSSWSTVIPQIIDGTPQDRITKIYVHDHNPLTTWHKNGVLLIGDAAHAPLPTTGQGACQALEDSVMLAELMVVKNLNSFEKACTELELKRLEKNNRIIEGGRALAYSLFNPDVNFCKQRDDKARNMNYNQMASAMAYGWR